jgi:BMFP domain-containing protein YqiC
LEIVKRLDFQGTQLQELKIATDALKGVLEARIKALEAAVNQPKVLKPLEQP